MEHRRLLEDGKLARGSGAGGVGVDSVDRVAGCQGGWLRCR